MNHEEITMMMNKIILMIIIIIIITLNLKFQWQGQVDAIIVIHTYLLKDL